MKYYFNNFIIAILGLTMSVTWAFGQSASKGLRPGDFLPPLQFKNVLNSSVVPLNILNKKAVVLEFGSTGCPPCIESIEKFQRFLEDYNQDLQVVSVTRESKQKVEHFLNTHPKGKNIFLPMIYEDTLLNSMFPYISFPHLVWISNSGKVKAITNHDYVTKEFIEEFLHEEELNWPVKWEFPLDKDTPLRVWNNEFKQLNIRPKHEQSITISTYIPSLHSISDIQQDTINKLVRHIAINQPLPALFNSAW